MCACIVRNFLWFHCSYYQNHMSLHGMHCGNSTILLQPLPLSMSSFVHGIWVSFLIASKQIQFSEKWMDKFAIRCFGHIVAHLVEAEAILFICLCIYNHVISSLLIIALPVTAITCFLLNGCYFGEGLLELQPPPGMVFPTVENQGKEGHSLQIQMPPMKSSVTNKTPYNSTNV